MKKLLKYFLEFCLVVLLSNCKKAGTEATTKCVDKIISEIKAEPIRNPPAKVFEWDFNGEKYIYVTSYCCDAFSNLYDDKCNIICHPDGGLTGKGDGACQDFSQGLTTKLIWEDERK